MPAKARSYSEKLKDPRWQKARLQVLERAGWKCEGCNAADVTLYVHHGHYRRGLEPWEYDPLTLWALCSVCHEEAEALRSEFYEGAAHIHPLRLVSRCLEEGLEAEDDMIFLARGDNSRVGPAATNSAAVLTFLKKCLAEAGLTWGSGGIVAGQGR